MKRIKVTSKKILAVLFVVFITANAASVMSSVMHDVDINYGTTLKLRLIGMVCTIWSGSSDDTKINVNKNQKYTYIDIFGAAQRAIGNRFIYDANPQNNEVLLNNGSLSRVSAKLDDNSASCIQDNFAQLSAFLSERGIDLLYVQLPTKLNTHKDLLPKGVEDYSYRNADRIISIASKCGFDILDIRESMKKDAVDSNSFFYKTDHHWNTDGMLYGTKILCETLNERYGFNADLSKLDKNQFTETVFKKRFLGSDGKRVGKLYAGIDDFTLLEPKFKTDVTFQAYDNNNRCTEKRGDFSSAYIDKSLLTGNLYRVNTYTTYISGDEVCGNSVLINNNIQDKKILIIRDSFTQLAAPFISLAACHELHLLDLRNYEASPLDYIKKINPDIVIVMFSTLSIEKDDTLFNFSGKEMTSDVS